MDTAERGPWTAEGCWRFWCIEEAKVCTYIKSKIYTFFQSFSPGSSLNLLKQIHQPEAETQYHCKDGAYHSLQNLEGEF